MLVARKIGVWNANGLIARAKELILFILQNNIDVMLISEIHFTHKSYVRIPNYSVYNTQHPDGTAHGGTAIIIKNSIKHQEAKQYTEDYIQATSIIVEDWIGTFALTAVYNPPKHNIKKEQYDQFLDTLGSSWW